MHSLLLAGWDSLASSMYSTFDFPEGAGGGLAQLLQLHPRHQALGTVQTTGFSLQQQDPASLSTQLQFKQGSSHYGKRCSAAQSLPAGDTIAQGKLLHGQGCSSAQSLPARDTIARGKLSHQPGMLSSTVSTCQRHIAHRPPCSSNPHANSVLQPLYIGNIFYLGSIVVPKPLPTSGSGDLSPKLGEEACAPLWCKTSMLLPLFTPGSVTQSW